MPSFEREARAPYPGYQHTTAGSTARVRAIGGVLDRRSGQARRRLRRACSAPSSQHRRGPPWFMAGLRCPDPTRAPLLHCHQACDAILSPPHAPVAQGIEQRFPKPRVAGSSPAGGTAASTILAEVTGWRPTWIGCGQFPRCSAHPTSSVGSRFVTRTLAWAWRLTSALPVSIHDRWQSPWEHATVPASTP